ncbi:MAG: periplasmic heavy metal sensor [Neomegalonema sp.]|nr:periplasmic heavy metal sensor [Neomegalonema sp.]
MMARRWRDSVLAMGMAALLVGVPAAAQDHKHAAAPYAGLQKRKIASLSEDDLAALRAGRGWGLALPAELNGLPGPAHVLELHAKLGLSAEQKAAVEKIFAAMRAKAISAGKRFIEAEAALSGAFAKGGVEKAKLRELLDAAATARADLRMAHLAAHIDTAKLLTPAQIKRYQALRGYADDPCANTPPGHDPTMWRKHNGCD